jgi:Caspase domain
MNEAATTWALLVGIDRYDVEEWQLDGPVLDTIDVVDWLRAVGVPPQQILTHVPESSEHKPELAMRGVRVAPATQTNINWSVSELNDVSPAAGTRLFVFWLGHGYWLDNASGGVFLTQECRTNAWATLGVEYYIKAFRSFGFRRTFLFFDACRTLPYPREQRQGIPAHAWNGAPVEALQIQANASLWACFASSQGEPAVEHGRGLFVREVLKALDVRRDWSYPPWSWAVRLGDGNHLEILFSDVFKQFVKLHVSAQAVALHGVQTPELVTIAGDDAAPILALADVIERADLFELRRDVSKIEEAQARGPGSWYTDALSFRSLLIEVREHHFRCDAFADLVSVHLPSLENADPDEMEHALARRSLRLALLDLDLCARAIVAKYEPIAQRLPESEGSHAAKAARTISDLVKRGELLCRHLAGSDTIQTDPLQAIATEGLEAILSLRSAVEATFSAAALRAIPRLEVGGRNGRDAVGLWAAATDTERLWEKVARLVVSSQSKELDLSGSSARCLARRMGFWGVPSSTGAVDESPLELALDRLSGQLETSELLGVVGELGAMADQVATLFDGALSARLRQTKTPDFELESA